MTHWTSTRLALSSRCSAGSATLTTVPSMNAMLEPRIVAARIHGVVSGSHGETQAAARMMPESDGDAENPVIASPKESADTVAGAGGEYRGTASQGAIRLKGEKKESEPVDS